MSGLNVLLILDGGVLSVQQWETLGAHMSEIGGSLMPYTIGRVPCYATRAYEVLAWKWKRGRSLDESERTIHVIVLDVSRWQNVFYFWREFRRADADIGGLSRKREVQSPQLVAVRGPDMPEEEIRAVERITIVDGYDHLVHHLTELHYAKIQQQQGGDS